MAHLRSHLPSKKNGSTWVISNSRWPTHAKLCTRATGTISYPWQVWVFLNCGYLVCNTGEWPRCTMIMTSVVNYGKPTKNIQESIPSAQCHKKGCWSSAPKGRFIAGFIAEFSVVCDNNFSAPGSNFAAVRGNDCSHISDCWEVPYNALKF